MFLYFLWVIFTRSVKLPEGKFPIPGSTPGLWDSSVLSTSSLLLFAAHWKRLLRVLDAELHAFELLPLERSRLEKRGPGGQMFFFFFLGVLDWQKGYL